MPYLACNHPGSEDVARYLSDGFDDGEYRALQHHLSWCMPCLKNYEAVCYDLETGITRIDLLLDCEEEESIEGLVDMFENLEESILIEACKGTPN